MNSGITSEAISNVACQSLFVRETSTRNKAIVFWNTDPNENLLGKSTVKYLAVASFKRLVVAVTEEPSLLRGAKGIQVCKGIITLRS